MTTFTVSGTATLPDDSSPLARGTWAIQVYTDSGVAFDGDGSWRAGVIHYDLDSAGALSISLPATDGTYLYAASFRSKDKKVNLGPYVFDLTANKTWQQVIDTPTIVPVTPASVALAQAAATTASAAATAAATSAAAAAAIGTTNDTLIAGRINASGSATDVALRAKLGGIVLNVRDAAYGAKGDGTTDDSAAIQAAINAAIAITNSGASARVYVPAGTYKIVTGLVVAGNYLFLHGDGRDKTILRYYGSGTNGILLSWDSSALRRDPRIEDLTLRTDATAGDGATCMRLHNVYKGVFRNLRLLGSGTNTIGLDGYGTSTTSTYYNAFYDVDIQASLASIRIDGLVTRWRFYNGILSGTGRALYCPASVSGQPMGTFQFYGTSFTNSATNGSFEMIRLGNMATDSTPSVGTIGDTQFIGCTMEGAGTNLNLILAAVASRTMFLGGTWSTEIQDPTEENPNLQGTHMNLPNRYRIRLPIGYEKHDYNVDLQGTSNGISGAYIGHPIATADAALTASRVYWWKVLVTKRFTFDQAVFRVAVASGNVDVGVYATSAGTVGAKIIAAGSTACPAAGKAVIALAQTTLEPGLYWLAFAVDNATATFGTNARQSEWLGLRVKSSTFPLPTSGSGQSATIASMPVMTLEKS